MIMDNGKIIDYLQANFIWYNCSGEPCHIGLGFFEELKRTHPYEILDKYGLVARYLNFKKRG
jgi:hypothetical protein